MRQTDEQAGRWNDGRMDKHPEGRGEKKNTDGDEDLRERESERGRRNKDLLHKSISHK